ncbi:MAG TPA: ABC transporter substrate binding protein [Bradyrhizobium sp.]|nr:ABC transporter substrate binding protein [Bradyrhizobium sp.]
MKRREFMTLIGGAAAVPLAARAQPGKLPTIGFLGSASPLTWKNYVAAFEQRLREFGWIEGRTVAIEYRWAEGRYERLADIAAEFVRLKVDVILTAGSAVPDAKQATSVIPIVFAVANDPLGTGLVASLARPGGNITGLSIQSHDLAGKRLIPPRCWKWTRSRQRPASLASRPPDWKSGALRISRPPLRRKRAAQTRFMSVPIRW